MTDNVSRASQVRILIADGEAAFRQSTAGLIEAEGFSCDCAEDAPTAEGMLRNNHYDLLIADIKMPGNASLELVRIVPLLGRQLPVILVTAAPSLETAMDSVQLPVIAYMIKPVEIAQLLRWVRVGVKLSETYAAVLATRRRLEDWSRSLDEIEALMRKPKVGAFALSAQAYTDLVVGQSMGSLRDLRNVIDLLTQGATDAAVCHLRECPRTSALTSGLCAAIEVIERTRRAFKSKDLAELRVTLERLLNEVKS